MPIAGLSTGTNNAFPEMREPTITGLAVGLYATGRLPADQALAPNKVLEVAINDGRRRDIALVDAVISTERFIGARALWKTESLRGALRDLRRPRGDRDVGDRRPAASVGRREPGGFAWSSATIRRGGG